MKRPYRALLENGLVLLHEQSRGLPIVDFELCLRTGAALEPPGQEGLTRLAWRVWRMGSRRLDQRQVDQAVSALGGRLAVEVTASVVRVKGVVIRRNLEGFFALLEELFREPAFRAKDVAFAKREAIADLVSLRDSDRALVGRAFRTALFADHAYGRSLSGSAKTLRKLSARVLREHWNAHVMGCNCVVGIAGDVARGEAQSLVAGAFGALRCGRASRNRLLAPKRQTGRRILIVHRVERPQCHLVIGTLGSRLGDADYDALAVANVAFGGTMASPLWQAVRESRGWSYSVSSRLSADRQRDAWSMYTVPEVDNASNCAALQLELLEQWIACGVSAEEHRLAKNHMVQSHCFEWDTAHKRMEHQIDAEVLPFPVERLAQYRKRVRAVSRQQSCEAVAKRLSSKHLAIVAVGDARVLEPTLQALPDVRSIQVVPHDQVF